MEQGKPDSLSQFQLADNNISGSVAFFAPFNVTEKPVAEEVIGYWTSFTRAGNPSVFKKSFSPLWPSYSGTQRVVMSQDVGGNGNRTASFVENVPVLESARCQWWMSQNETRV